MILKVEQGLSLIHIYRGVTDGAARLDHILHAAAAGAVDVVGEGEEGVGAKGYAIQLLQPLLSFLSGNCLLYTSRCV